LVRHSPIIEKTSRQVGPPGLIVTRDAAIVLETRKLVLSAIRTEPLLFRFDNDRAPILSRAVDKTVRVLGSSPHCSINHSGPAEIFLRLRQKPRIGRRSGGRPIVCDGSGVWSSVAAIRNARRA
jgi:hypothetical protein